MFVSTDNMLLAAGSQRQLQQTAPDAGMHRGSIRKRKLSIDQAASGSHGK
jgi:hypothetical protein